MTPQDVGERLHATELFASLDEVALAALAAAVRVRTYSRGELVFAEGDAGDGLYVVHSGRVKISVESPDGDSMLLATLSAPETFGELALIDGDDRSANAEALEPCELLWIGRQAFHSACEHHPQLTQTLLLILGRLLRRVTGQAADLALLDLEGRIARLVLRLAADAGPAAELDLGLTQTDLASMVGGSRQSVNQILQDLQRAGYLEISGRRLRVLRADALRRRAGL
jgi:CRP/FNR family transcriptional regulator, cyclic AMP receptor protein